MNTHTHCPRAPSPNSIRASRVILRWCASIPTAAARRIRHRPPPPLCTDQWRPLLLFIHRTLHLKLALTQLLALINAKLPLNLRHNPLFVLDHALGRRAAFAADLDRRLECDGGRGDVAAGRVVGEVEFECVEARDDAGVEGWDEGFGS